MTVNGHLRDDDDISFSWIKWHYSAVLLVTLRWLLSTVHSEQQECTPDRRVRCRQWSQRIV